MSNVLTHAGVAEKVAIRPDQKPQIPGWRDALRACQGILETIAALEALRAADAWDQYQRDLVSVELVRVGRCAYVLAERFERKGR